MASAERSRNAKMTKQLLRRAYHHSDFVIPSTFDIRHPSLAGRLIATRGQLAELIPQIEAADRIALDTEADSLHSYREKLCLIQISVPAVTGIVEAGRKQHGLGMERDRRSRLQRDFIVDPLRDLDLEPLRRALEAREIVLHGADYDLRMLRRGLNFIARKIFDTVVAARLLGIREFSLRALVKRYFGTELPKGSQKANWAKRPLPARMAEYALNDVHYLLPLAKRLETELDRHQRLDWFRQSCQRAIEQAATARTRSQDELWRIPGAGALDRCAAAVLRALWQWREREAEMADRPPFHILRNEELLKAAVDFASGRVPDYEYFSARRRRMFNEAAKLALESPESEWPRMRRRFVTRPTAETIRRAEQLRRRRDKSAKELGLDPSFIASRGTLETIVTDRSPAAALLVPWQRELLGIGQS